MDNQPEVEPLVEEEVSTEVAPEGTTIVQQIPLVDTVQEDADQTMDPAEQRMATVQLGDLSGHSVQDLAEHLPNIGIHFTCKKCNISCNQMSEVLAHFTDGNCTGQMTTEGGNQETHQAKTTPAPIIMRKRGRPKKSERKPPEPLFTVSKEAEYEELPRIAAPVNTAEKSTGRRTRYSEGKIKRLDVLTLLGGRIKEEPLDEDEEYRPPPQVLLQKRMLEDDEIHDTQIIRRPRGRPKKIKLQSETVQVPTEVMEFCGEEGEDGIASLTIEKAGNSQVIVVNRFKPESSDPTDDDHVEEEPDDIEAEKRAINIVPKSSDETNTEESQAAKADKDFDETEEGSEESIERGHGKEDEDNESITDNESSPTTNKEEKLCKATPRTVYNYTNTGPKKRQYKCKTCKQRFFYTLPELQLHTQCHTNQRGERESYGCIAADCTYATTFWNRMLDHIITHPDYRERLRDAPFLKNIVGSFSCPICKKKFERKNNMKGHFSKVHFKQDRTCEICGLVMTSSDEKTYKRHVEKCQNLLFQCSHCDYKSPVSANMRKHMKIHLGQGFTCEVCNALFPTKQRYTVHRAIHDQQRQQYMCEVCGQAFMSQDAVKKHIVRFHVESNQLFQCPECAFTSKIQTDLKKHIVSVHNKKFQCPHCPFQTNSPTSFEQHSEYHKPGRSFACAYANCFYRGATGKQLSNHIGQVHKLSSKHECPVCHKLYKKKTHLARHLVVHTGDKPYVCLDCDMAFSSHSTYYRHRQRTGHDSKREGIVSVPQNITIQYINQQDLSMVEAEGTQKIVQSLDDPEAYQIVQEGEAVEYVTEEPVAEETEKQNIIILENENGEQVTYMLKMNEEDGAPTIVSEDGVLMDAGLAQQIHAQLQQLQGSEQATQEQYEEVVVASLDEGKGAIQVTSEQGLHVLQGGVVEEVEPDEEHPTQIVYTTEEQEDTHNQQVVHEGTVQVIEMEDQQDTHNEQNTVQVIELGDQQDTHNQQDTVQVIELGDQQDTHNQQDTVQVIEMEDQQDTHNQQDTVQVIEMEDQQDANDNQQETVQLIELEDPEDTHNQQDIVQVIEMEDPEETHIVEEEVHQELVSQEQTQEEGVHHQDLHQEHVMHQEQVHQQGVHQEQLVRLEGDGESQTVLIVQQGEEGQGHVEQDAVQHLEQNWVHLTEDGLVTSDVIQVQQVDGEQEIQQVIYEESVVEVDNPHGGDNDTQYAIVLLPSSAACGDEPEAALSMLQLQSGSNMVVSDNDGQIIMQQEQA